jgi:hypothetical protein
MAGATDENLGDVKQLADLSAGYAQFLKGINYDFNEWKKWVTDAHAFIASNM